MRGIEISEAAEPPDETPPVITLVGDNPMYVVVGTTFTDPGATALDDRDGPISSDQIVVGGDTVNTSVEDEYTITYDVQDAAGNDAVQVTRTVIVVGSGTALYRLNAGGPTLSATDDGPDYVGISGNGTFGGVTVAESTSNRHYEAINTDGVSLALTGDDTEALFQTTLYDAAGGGNMTFAFDVPNGNYDLEASLRGAGDKR